MTAEQVQALWQRDGHWAIVDPSGKAGRVRTIPVPDWMYSLVDEWTKSAGIESGCLFRRVSSAGRAWSDGVTEKAVWHVVKEFAATIGVMKLASHDLRRSCARLCRAAGGDWSRFNSFLARSRSRPQSAISAVLSGFHQRWTIGSASSQRCAMKLIFRRVADNPPAGPRKRYGVTRERWSDSSPIKKCRSGVVVVGYTCVRPLSE